MKKGAQDLQCIGGFGLPLQISLNVVSIIMCLPFQAECVGSCVQTKHFTVGSFFSRVLFGSVHL